MTQAATVEVKLTVNKGNLEAGMRRAETVTKKTSTGIVKAQKQVVKSSGSIQEGFRRASQSIAACVIINLEIVPSTLLIHFELLVLFFLLYHVLINNPHMQM